MKDNNTGLDVWPFCEEYFYSSQMLLKTHFLNESRTKHWGNGKNPLLIIVVSFY